MSNRKLFRNTCPTCFDEFETEWETKVYCRRYCKERAREMRRPDYKPLTLKRETRVCMGCQSAFDVRPSSLRKYCSDQCSNWYAAQKKRDRENSQWKASKTPLLKARIFYRDKGLCQLCQQPIDLTLTYPNPMMFSVDHIVPRSQGGSHKLDNLQAAHLICNSRRGDKPINN